MLISLLQAGAVVSTETEIITYRASPVWLGKDLLC